MEQRLLLIKFLLVTTCLMCSVNGGDTYQKSNKMNQLDDGMMKIRKLAKPVNGEANHDIIIGYNVGSSILKFSVPSDVLRTTPFSYSVVHLGLEPMVNYNPMPQMHNMEYSSSPPVGWHMSPIVVHNF